MSVWMIMAIVFGLAILVVLTIGAFYLFLGLWYKAVETGKAVDDLRIGSAHERLGLERQKLAADRDRLNLDRDRLKVVEKVYPDPQGNYPILWNGTRALNPNMGVVFSIQDGAQVVTPGIAKPEQLARILRAAGGWPSGTEAGKLLAEPEQPVNWPARVPLTGLLEGQQPSFRNLILGVTLSNGKPEIVRGDMAQLVHVALGGSSGWGKSVMLRSLAYQLALSEQPVDLAMCDLEGATFAPFSQCGRLLWPVADSETDALALFGELTNELNRRRDLFTGYPGTDSLRGYNAVADEPISPIVCLVDEATALLSYSGVEGALRTLALRGRKFGLWLSLGGQDWKASSLDSAIRNQLSTRIQFRAMSASQSRVLLQRAGAENLDAKGRALAWLPGRDLLEIQAPYISHGDIIEAVSDGGPQATLPEPPRDETAETIRQLDAEGLSASAIAERTYGYKNARVLEQIRVILDG